MRKKTVISLTKNIALEVGKTKIQLQLAKFISADKNRLSIDSGQESSKTTNIENVFGSKKISK